MLGPAPVWMAWAVMPPGGCGIEPCRAGSVPPHRPVLEGDTFTGTAYWQELHASSQRTAAGGGTLFGENAHGLGSIPKGCPEMPAPCKGPGARRQSCAQDTGPEGTGEKGAFLPSTCLSLCRAGLTWQARDIFQATEPHVGVSHSSGCDGKSLLTHVSWIQGNDRAEQRSRRK